MSFRAGRSWIILLILILCVPLAALEPLSDQDVIQMIQAGFGEETIIKAIEANGVSFDRSVQELLQLKNAGVSETVIRAMLAKSSEGSEEAAPSSGKATLPSGHSRSTELAVPGSPVADPGRPTAGAPPFSELGVYYKKGGRWVEALPEIVNWKTGGILKTIATVGIVKGDVNGHIPRLHSRNSLAMPAEFMIHTDKGIAITEYQLLRHRAKKQ